MEHWGLSSSPQRPDQLGFLEVQAMKHAMIGVALLLLATSVWAGTLRDDFDDGDMDEWDLSLSGAGSIWEIKDGELVITPRGGVLFFIGETTWENYTVRVRTRIVKHRSTGGVQGPNVLVREQFRPLPEHHLYVFGLGDRGGGKIAYAFYPRGNTPMHFVSKPFEWELDKWYDLKLTAEGEQFWFYVDNQLMIHYTDDVHPKGKVGIGSGGQETTAHFDDFSVTGDDVPDLDLDVSPEVKLATTWGQVKGQ
jgi:hypothetical protein